MLTGKLITLMTPGVTFSLSTLSHFTLLAVHKSNVRETTIASNIFCRKIFAVRKCALASSSSLVESYQPFLEFLIVITVCNMNGTYSAIEATRGRKFRIYFHSFDPSLIFIISNEIIRQNMINGRLMIYWDYHNPSNFKILPKSHQSINLKPW
jgi:hypothetical protein